MQKKWKISFEQLLCPWSKLYHETNVRKNFRRPIDRICLDKNARPMLATHLTLLKVPLLTISTSQCRHLYRTIVKKFLESVRLHGTAGATAESSQGIKLSAPTVQKQKI